MSRCSALYIKILHNIFYTLVLLPFYLFLYKSLLLSRLLFNKQCLVQLIHTVPSPFIFFPNLSSYFDLCTTRNYNFSQDVIWFCDRDVNWFGVFQSSSLCSTCSLLRKWYFSNKGSICYTICYDSFFYSRGTFICIAYSFHTDQKVYY